MQQGQECFTCEHPFPKIRGGVPVGIGGIPTVSDGSGAVTSLVEGKEVGVVALEFRSHCHFIQVNSEIDKDTIVEMEYELLGVAVIHKLPLGVAYGLTCQLVLEFNGHNRNTVQGENHINRVVVLRGVGKLTRLCQDIGFVLGHEVVVEV